MDLLLEGGKLLKEKLPNNTDLKQSIEEAISFLNAYLSKEEVAVLQVYVNSEVKNLGFSSDENSFIGTKESFLNRFNQNLFSILHSSLNADGTTKTFDDYKSDLQSLIEEQKNYSDLDKKLKAGETIINGPFGVTTLSPELEKRLGLNFESLENYFESEKKNNSLQPGPATRQKLGLNEELLEVINGNVKIPAFLVTSQTKPSAPGRIYTDGSLPQSWMNSIMTPGNFLQRQMTFPARFIPDNINYVLLARDVSDIPEFQYANGLNGMRKLTNGEYLIFVCMFTGRNGQGLYNEVLEAQTMISMMVNAGYSPEQALRVSNDVRFQTMTKCLTDFQNDLAAQGIPATQWDNFFKAWGSDPAIVQNMVNVMNSRYQGIFNAYSSVGFTQSATDEELRVAGVILQNRMEIMLRGSGADTFIQGYSSRVVHVNPYSSQPFTFNPNHYAELRRLGIIPAADINMDNSIEVKQALLSDSFTTQNLPEDIQNDPLLINQSGADQIQAGKFGEFLLGESRQPLRIQPVFNQSVDQNFGSSTSSFNIAANVNPGNEDVSLTNLQKLEQLKQANGFEITPTSSF